MKRALVTFLFLLLVLPALACSLTSAEPTQTPQPTAIPATDTPVPTEASPTDTPIPPTETPAPTPTLPPDPRADFVDYQSDALGLAFQYPESWTVDEAGAFISVVSDAAILDSQDFTAGAGVILISDPTMGDQSPEDVLDQFVSPDAGLFADAEVVSEPTPLLINGQVAVQATYLGTLEEVPVKATITVIVKGQAAGVAVALTPREGEEALEPVLNEIVSSIIVLGTGGPQEEGNVNLGQSVEGTVPANTASTWSFTAETASTVSILVVPGADLDAVVDVLDADGQSVLPDGPVDESFDQEEIQGLALDAGTYTISVTGFGSSAGKYTLTISTSQGVLSDAEPIAFGDILEGSLSTNGTATYVFAGLATETVDIAVVPDGDLDVVVTLYDAIGKELQSTDESYGDEYVAFTPDEDDDYYVQVTSFDGSAGTFTISVNAGVSELPLIPANGLLLSEIATAVAENESIDYTLTALQYHPYTIIVASIDDFDAIVEVLAPDGSQLMEQDYSYEQEEVLFIPPEDGEYTVRVTGYDGMAGSYDLDIFRGGIGGVGVTGSVIVTGDTLAESNESHAYPFTAISDTPVAAMVRPEPGLDIVVEVVDDDTDKVLQTIDNTYGYERLLFMPPPDGGNYYISVSGFDGATGSYDITLFGGPDIFFELAVGDTIYGTLGDDSFAGYTYRGYAGDMVTVTVIPTADLDAVLELEPLEGDPYASVDENLEGETETVDRAFTDDELIFIVVRGFDGDTGSFVLNVEAQ